MQTRPVPRDFCRGAPESWCGRGQEGCPRMEEGVRRLTWQQSLGGVMAEWTGSFWRAGRHTGAVATVTSARGSSRRGCEAGHASAFGTLCVLVCT